jgi:Uma2 family endonuclease
MSLRHRNHSEAMAQISHYLVAWALRQSGNRPRVYAGDGFFRLRRNPDTDFGIDVAVASAEQVAASPANARFIEGAPILAIEILSASDMVEDIQEKKDEYLKNGTQLVWLVDPFQQTITVYRPGSQPVLFNNSQRISGDPELPGFSAAVADLFG